MSKAVSTGSSMNTAEEEKASAAGSDAGKEAADNARRGNSWNSLLTGKAATSI